MKVSKKILGAVLCGLIVVGGSQATLVKANAQQTKWRIGVGFATHMIGIGMGTTYPKLDLVLYNDGKLQLEGSPYVACNRTFSDTFRIGWKKNDQKDFVAPIVFRQCWKADAQRALRNVVTEFNRAGIKEGDEIFIHGEGNNNSIKFYDLDLIEKPTSIRMSSKPYEKSYNHGWTLYENLPRHCTAFSVTDKGLKVVQKDVYHGRVCPR